MTIRVNVKNENKKRSIDLLKIKRIAQIVLKSLGKEKTGVNIVFLSNQRIRGLNRVYLGIDKATDVLAFPITENYELRTTNYELRFSGDIAISTDKAAENRRLYGTTFMEETALYVIHGILHLAGYDDTAKNKKNRMQRKENELLQKSRALLS